MTETTCSPDRTFAAWSIAGVAASAGLLIPLNGLNCPACAPLGISIAAVALFLATYISIGARKVRASIGFPVGLVLVFLLEPLLAGLQGLSKLAVEAGVMALVGTVVANTVNRRSALRTAVESILYALAFGLAFFVELFLGYMMLSVPQIFLPHTMAVAVAATVLTCCVAGGLAGAFVGASIRVVAGSPAWRS